ncbi:hypothetical protein D9Q98_003370 [Chlorella vulgaris]|uniref:Carboxypeptidase n=1 Tax=Chlorella vulgaris TaxID=3077 RepID=A0A9D4TSE5_CHLVU|nr:hypothetical protein D9Q98_003370 [Chlorella vulgaris]
MRRAANLIAVGLLAALLQPFSVSAVLRPAASDAASLRPTPAEVARRHRGDEIRSVPGFRGTLPTRHYAGYITVDEERGRHLYYYFVQSQHKPSKDPVVLWLNGGPGCSSLGGFVNEHGPFSFSFKGGKDAKGRHEQQLELGLNPHSWNQVANMLYVDSPAGVGMSYAETKADAHTNDTHTAADMNTFLRLWFAKFEEFQGNDFFVSGESYAGVYVPLVSQAVLDGNDAGQEPRLRLRGYLIGNGVTDDEFDGNAIIPFAYGKSLISQELFEEATSSCGGSFWNASKGTACDHAVDKVYHAIKGINIYDILEPCYHGHNPYTQAAALAAAVSSHRQWPLLGGLKPGPVAGFGELVTGLAHIPPCLDSREMWAFCNDDAVREAIHAEPINKIGAFDECTNGERIHYTHDAGSMLPVHRDLIDRGLTGLIYSGDHDMAVPHTGSEAWTAWMGKQLGVERPWGPWHTADHQVAGYAVHYKQLVYATVLGAGHMVPETKPAAALALFARFLKAVQSGAPAPLAM